MPQAGQHARASLVLRWLALAAYPALVAWAWWTDESAWRALGLPLLAIALIGPPLTWGRAGVLVLTAGLAGLVVVEPALALWPPGVILMALAAAFALSLRRDQTPMIARFAHAVERQRGQRVPAGSGAWLRGWTWVWTLALASLGLVAIALAIADAEVWWLAWVMGVVPAAVLLVLTLELLLRRRRFPQQPDWPLLRFLLALARIRPGLLAP